MKRRMSFRFLIAVSFGSLLWSHVTQATAWAHAYPASSSPEDGVVVGNPPREVVIRFTEGVELEFSRIEVKSTRGDVVSQGKVRRVAADTLAVDIKPLAPGAYIVEWQVLSVDTHVTDGALRFTVSSGGN